MLTKMGWFERMEGRSGAIAFTHLADSKEELEDRISRTDLKADLYELSPKYQEMVSEEFLGQSRSFPDSPEDSVEEYEDDRDQTYHRHD